MTEQEKQEIVQAVLAEIEANAQEMESATVVETLDNITSMPALRNNVVVRVPMSLLTAHANDVIASLTAMKGNVEAAIAAAKIVADNPTKVGDDYYVYAYNADSGEYERTNIYVKGERGATGEKGETGAAGATGPAGPAGPAGAAGKDGVDGTNGSDGVDGKTPQLQISDTGLWEVSYDNGSTFTSLGVSAVGENPDKGLFDSVQNLQAAYPTPIIGWTALVGTATPLAVYKCSTAGVWTDTGMTADVGGIDLSNLVYISD